LWRRLDAANLKILRPFEVLIARTHRDLPDSRSVAEALVYARTRLGDVQGALEIAGDSYALQPDDPRRARLAFEAALLARDESAAAGALEALRKAGLEFRQINLIQLRLMLLTGAGRDAEAELVRLARDEPDDPYYHYYYGCAELGGLESAEDADLAIESAFDAFKRASLRARSRHFQDRIGRTLNYVRSILAGEKPEEEKPPAPIIFTP